MCGAFLASVDDDELIAFFVDGRRLHKATAGVGPVARLNINMFAAQAVRAVVGIAVAFHLCIAMFTDEVFNLALELFA